MKKLLRNDLWISIVAWCLYLNGYFILGIITSAIAAIYLFAFIKNKNWWRMIALYLICFSLSYYLASKTIISVFRYLSLFTAMNSLNVVLLNERLNKERLSTLYLYFMISFATFFIFLIVSLILPNSQILMYKTNMYSLVILIFVPYTSEMMINLLVKETKRAKFLNQIKMNSSKL